MRLLSTLFLSGLLALQPAWCADIALMVGNHRVHAELANTPQSREHGLMQRDHLCADCGMLFVFAEAGRYSFWMKDTSLPLSIAFIAANGSVINIEEMQPNTTDLHSAKGYVLYALEMPGGWFARNGIKPGHRVRGVNNVPAAR